MPWQGQQVATANADPGLVNDKRAFLRTMSWPSADARIVIEDIVADTNEDAKDAHGHRQHAARRGCFIYNFTVSSCKADVRCAENWKLETRLKRRTKTNQDSCVAVTVR